MKYRIAVILEDPNSDGMLVSTFGYDMVATFASNEKQYGNGTSVVIESSAGFEVRYDIRYDNSYHLGKEKEWLEQWANGYWNGKDGAFKVKTMTIQEIA